MSETSFDAAELVARITGGDRSAEACLVDHFSHGVGYLLRHLTGDRAVAEDLHQETFRIVLEKLRRGELREAEKVAAFIRGTARNLVLAERRRRQRQRQQGSAPEEPADEGQPSALGRMIAAQDRRLVRQLLRELRLDRDRELLLRFYIAEEPKAAICASLGLSVRQFNVAIFRARQRFRRLVESVEAGRRQEPP